jgi:hypothetical protein
MIVKLTPMVTRRAIGMKDMVISSAAIGFGDDGPSERERRQGAPDLRWSDRSGQEAEDSQGTANHLNLRQNSLRGFMYRRGVSSTCHAFVRVYRPYRAA